MLYGVPTAANWCLGPTIFPVILWHVGCFCLLSYLQWVQSPSAFQSCLFNLVLTTSVFLASRCSVLHLAVLKKRFVWIPQLNAHKINGQNVVWWLEMANTQNSALPLHVVEYMIGDCGYFVFNPPAGFNVSTEVQGASYFSLCGFKVQTADKACVLSLYFTAALQSFPLKALKILLHL